MRVIPVLDVRHGQAVHAVAGDRDHYRPVSGASCTRGTDPVGSRPQPSGTRWGLPDPLPGRPRRDRRPIPSRRRALPEALRRPRADPLAVDAGVRVAADVDAAGRSAGVERSIVVGLETVEGPEALAGIVDRGLGRRTGSSSASTSATAGRWSTTGVRWGTNEVESIVRHGQCIRCSTLPDPPSRPGAGRDLAGGRAGRPGDDDRRRRGGSAAGCRGRATCWPGRRRPVIRRCWSARPCTRSDGRIEARPTSERMVGLAPDLTLRDRLAEGSHRPSDQLTMWTWPPSSSK